MLVLVFRSRKHLHNPVNRVQFPRQRSARTDSGISLPVIGELQFSSTDCLLWYVASRMANFDDLVPFQSLSRCIGARV